MVIMILSEKLVEVISVGTPLTSPVACFDRAGKGSCLTSTGDIVMRACISGSEGRVEVVICISCYVILLSFVRC